MTKEDSTELDLAQLLGKAFDIVRYAPIGALLDGPSLLPELAERGKVHVKNAEFLGRLALKQVATAAAPQVQDFLRMMGLIPPGQVTPAHEAPKARETAMRTNAAAPEASTLAIPDYDSLSASQVVNRLPSLTPDELEAVRAYEAAHRGRKTILNKAAQLG
ncbi:MAG: hypothetical protein ACRD2C_13965 [Acidimicrobiales bacterium]